jgi:ribosomal protein L10
LPRAQIFTVELLPEASRVFDSQRSWLFSEYEGLELEALDEARRKLRQEAERNTAMLEVAETMARLQLGEFLRKAGFERVEIEFER